MSLPKKYMAASVPRFLRQTRLNYLPLSCIIGSRLVKGNSGANLYFDIVMLPMPEFQRMKSNVGLQHVIAPALKAGPAFNPGFVLADAKHVTVPVDEPDPENFARNHFIKEFGLIAPDVPAGEPARSGAPLQQEAGFSESAGECTIKPAPGDDL